MSISGIRPRLSSLSSRALWASNLLLRRQGATARTTADRRVIGNATT